MNETFDFGDGPVPAHRHINPDKSIGGWVADTAQVSGNAQVYGDALVFENARVSNEKHIISGTILKYHFTFTLSNNNLLYGCESLKLEEWPSILSALCQKHEPKEAKLYEQVLSNLIEMLKSYVEATKGEKHE